MPTPEEDPITQNLVRFLKENLKEGQDAQIAVHPELRKVLVFVGRFPLRRYGIRLVGGDPQRDGRRAPGLGDAQS